MLPVTSVDSWIVEGAERGVRLEHRVVRRADARQLVEVVHHEHGVEPGRLRLAGLRGHGVEQILDRDAGIGEVRNLVAEPDAHVASTT